MESHHKHDLVITGHKLLDKQKLTGTRGHGTSGTLSRLLVRGHGIHDRSALHIDTAMSSLDNRDASVTSEIMSWAQLRNCTDSEHANPAHKSESPR